MRPDLHRQRRRGCQIEIKSMGIRQAEQESRVYGGTKEVTKQSALPVMAKKANQVGWKETHYSRID